MKNILFHVSDEADISILEPRNVKDKIRDEAICFSKNTFASGFGQYIYMFDFDMMNKAFQIKRREDPGTFQFAVKHNNMTYTHNSNNKLEEYRIYTPIDVKKYSIGVYRHFDLKEGYTEIQDSLIAAMVRDKVIKI